MTETYADQRAHDVTWMTAAEREEYDRPRYAVEVPARGWRWTYSCNTTEAKTRSEREKVDIYVALYEESSRHGPRADVLGAWSTAEKARTDCQRWENTDEDARTLEWVGDSASVPDGTYRVWLVALDEPAYT